MILINILFLSAGLLGLTVSLISLKNYKLNQIINIYFILFLGITSIRQIILGIFLLFGNEIIMDKYYIHSSFSLLVMPIIYLYFKKIAANDNGFDFKELIKNSIFPIGLISLIVCQIHFNIDMLNTRLFELIQYVIHFLFSAFYVYISFKVVSKKIWSRSVSKISKRQNDLINSWTKFIFVAISLLPLKLFFTIVIKLFEIDSSHFLNFLPITNIITIIICLKILCSPQIFYGYDIINLNVNENIKSKLILDKVWNLSNNITPRNEQDENLKKRIDSYILVYIEKIEKIAFENDLLIKSEITISDISNKLSIPKSHLLYLFKYHSNVSFIEFKKIIRINYATKLIKDDFLKNETLNSLSKKVGFSSYDPFYRSFKDITGNSPIDYYNYVHLKKIYF